MTVFPSRDVLQGMDEKQIPSEEELEYSPEVHVLKTQGRSSEQG